MFTVITVVHILSCIFLILVVLLQTGKGADMGAVFGGSSSTVFGSSGAGTFLTRLTTATAVVFMVTSLSLTYFSSQRHSATVFDSAPSSSSAPEEAAPGAPAPGAGAAPAPVEPAPEPEANAAPPDAAAPAPDAAPAQPATN